MRLLISGDREYETEWVLVSVLDELLVADPQLTLIEGEARGADTMARVWAERRGVPVSQYPADWKKYGRAAGPLRNREMLDKGNPDRLVAFHNRIYRSRGTYDMMRQAIARHIRTDLATLIAGEIQITTYTSATINLLKT